MGSWPLFSRDFLAICLQYGLGHLLDEQGNAVGPIDQIFPELRWEKLVAGNSVNDGVDVATTKPIDGDGGHVWKADPWRHKFWSERNNEQHANDTIRSKNAADQFETGRIGPVSILEDHQYGREPRKGPQPG